MERVTYRDATHLTRGQEVLICASACNNYRKVLPNSPQAGAPHAHALELGALGQVTPANTLICTG